MDETTYWVNTVEQQSQKDWTIAVTMSNDRTARFKVDTGAQCNVIPLQMYQELAQETSIKESSVKRTSYSGHTIDVVGMDKLEVTQRGVKHNLAFQIVKGKVSPLIRLSASEAMGLIVRADAIKENAVFREYAHVFEGTGELKVKHTIRLQDGTQPFICAPRQTPHAIKDKLEDG